MRKFVINIVLMIAIQSKMEAQITVGGIKFNNLTAYVNSNGKLFDSLSNPGLFANINGQNVSLIESAGIWLHAIDANNINYFSAHNVLSNNDEYWAGPLDTNSANSANPNLWNNVYKIHKFEIDSHRRSFRNSNYEILSNIKNWPGSGTESYARFLAPFADYIENDRIYKPENGDFPIIKGDAMLYSIFNDNYANHTFSNALPLEVEVQNSIYGIHNSKDTHLNNVIIVRYVIHNRGQSNYNNFKFGQVIRFKIGSNHNEFIGTDIKNKTFFAFNDTSEAAFGNKFVSIGCMMLNQDLGSTIYFENNNNSVNGYPTQLSHFTNYMNSTWKNGQGLTFGSNGVDGSGSSKYVYSYNTDDNNNNIDWNETSTGNSSGERIGLLTSNSMILNSKQTKVFELAFFFVEDSSLNIKQYQNYCSTLKAKLVAQNLLKNQNISESFAHSIIVYPNPSQIGAPLKFNNNNSFDVQVSIFGMDGKVFFQQILQFGDNVIYLPQNLESGIYNIEFKSLNNITTQKLILTNY